MLFKIAIIILMLSVVFNLGKGMYCLLHDKGEGTRTVKSLSWRIGLSLGLFIFLLISYRFGWLHPHALGGI